MNFNNDLTIHRCREVFDYDPNTGNLIWRVRTCMRIKVGNTAGAVNKDGYLRAHIGITNPAVLLVCGFSNSKL